MLRLSISGLLDFVPTQPFCATKYRAKAGKTLAAMPAERAAYLAERIGDAALRKELTQ